MIQRKNVLLLFTILFIFVFVYVSKNSDLSRQKKFFISVKLAWIILVFGVGLYPANGKDIIPLVHGFKQNNLSTRNLKFNKFNNPALGQARRNIGKRVSPGANKLPRAESGFRISPESFKNQGLYAGATGFGGGGSSYPELPGDDSNSNNNQLNKESSDQFKNPNYWNKEQKKQKKKKNHHEVSKERTIVAHQHFMSKMKKKGYEFNISEERFLELAINSETGKFDEKSIYET